MYARLISLLFLGLMFSSCSLMSPARDSWAKAIFAPSPSSESAACDEGFRIGSVEKTIKPSGYVNLDAVRGRININSRLGKINFLCMAIGLLNGRKPQDYGSVFQTNIMLEDTQYNKDQTLVTVILQGDRDEPLATLNFGETANEEDRHWYSATGYNADQLEAMDKALSFTISIERGLGLEKYAFTPQSYPAVVNHVSGGTAHVY
jgi:hypothetical protein